MAEPDDVFSGLQVLSRVRDLAEGQTLFRTASAPSGCAAKVRLYDKDAVLAAFKHNPDAAKSFMTRLARQVMDLRTHMELRNIKSARERTRHYLALHAGADGATVAVNGTLKELAAELGLTHESLYRTLSRMAAKGEIKRFDGKIMRARFRPRVRPQTCSARGFAAESPAR
jgi:CRP/FNR family transcriptional regulator, dissimilatory nitrate respiration regulator